MSRIARMLVSLIAIFILLGIVAFALVPTQGRAVTTDPNDPMYYVDGPGASGSGSSAAENASATTAAVKKESPTVTSSTTTNTGGGSYGPAIVPAATPCVVTSYSTDPGQLQVGSRFNLSLTIKNPGTDSADDVVVLIGPSADSGWSAGDLVVLGTGSAQYIGSIDAGADNSKAVFSLMANPSSSGGVREVPIKMTWKSKGYEHTAQEMVGLLINSNVDMDLNLHTTSAQYAKTPFGAAITIKNNTNRTVKDVMVQFAAAGAMPSNGTSQSIGDIGPNATRTLPVKYTAQLAGRAKLSATLSYADDFGDRRVLTTSAWARVQRAAPAPTTDQSSAPTLTDQIIAVAEALVGLNG